MPELAEVETVKESLKQLVLGKTIAEVAVYYPAIIAYPNVSLFQKQLIGKTIEGMKRRGKWLLFEIGDLVLFSHLRMEGKYLIRTKQDKVLKHEHVVFTFTDQTELRYQDTRKFGRMYLYPKAESATCKPMQEVGLEPWDPALTVDYLKQQYQNKKIPIKTALLDQKIVAGLGNIYANEVLFVTHIHPLTPCCQLTKRQLYDLIDATKKVLEKAIALGGTTIRTYTSQEGVHGRFQNQLLVHGKEGESCVSCYTKIEKMKVGGRGTYYCPKCQKEEKK